jgi:catechol 2,3-dioxygenase-like lactoylglutathione lyase family enzyme
MRLKVVNIVSSNPARLAAFYRNILGVEIDDTHGGPGRIEMWFGERESGTGITVHFDPELSQGGSKACHGFEFTVQNIDEFYEKLHTNSVNINKPLQNLAWGYRFFNILDPDGNSVDFVQKL